jgi:N-acetylglucosamine repressor
MNKERLTGYGIRRGDRQLMVEMNRNLVLNVLRTGAVSRAEVVRASGLSPATVSAIVAELIAADLVLEVGQGESTGGRPPQVLRLNDTANFVVGIKLMAHAISVVITDLLAEVVHAEIVGLPAAAADSRPAVPARPVPVQPVLDAVSRAVRAAIRKSGVGQSGNVVGVGVGIGGLVDAEQSICRYSPVFGWTDTDVAGPLATSLGLPVLVENDVNALTIAEQWFGRGHGVSHFLVVTVGAGIGAGIVTHGKLYRGGAGGAGELGHMPLAGIDAVCSCGATGCLEAVASDGAILRAVLAAAPARGGPDPLDGVASPAIADIRRAAENGDEICATALREAGAMLGRGIAGLVNLLDPDLVIIGGEGIEAGPLRFDAMSESLRQHRFGGAVQEVQLVTDPVDDITWARGAACVVLNELFTPPMHRSGNFMLMPGPGPAASGAAMASPALPGRGSR